jgi:hypothetical protein
MQGGDFMSRSVDPDDHPLRPEDEDSELRYDERTTEDETDASDVAENTEK